jgi:putative PIN family toxin of toxin-antitoxin system
MTSTELVVVCDTNVLIPLIIKASQSVRLFLRLQAAGIPVILSPQINAEVRDKMMTKKSLRRWLNVTDAEIVRFGKHDLPAMTRLIPGNKITPGAVPADPKDDMIIAAAIEGGACYIVSEDRHMLDLKEYQGIKIMRIAEFEAELDRLGVPAMPR